MCETIPAFALQWYACRSDWTWIDGWFTTFVSPRNNVLTRQESKDIIFEKYKEDIESRDFSAYKYESNYGSTEMAGEPPGYLTYEAGDKRRLVDMPEGEPQNHRSISDGIFLFDFLYY